MQEIRSPSLEPKLNGCLLAYPEVKNEFPWCLFGIASRSRRPARIFFQFGPTDSNLIPVPVDRHVSFLSSGRPTRIAASIRVGKLESLCRFGSPDSNRFADSGRPTRIALPIRVIRVGRDESRCRFGSAASNCCVDSGRPTRIALSFRVGRFESLCRFGSADSNHCVDSGATFTYECRFGSAGPNRFVDSGEPT